MRGLVPVLFGCALAGSACVGPPGAPGSVLVIDVDDDTYVSEADTEDHSAEELLEASSLAPQSWAYMKFELVGFDDVLLASFRFHVQLLSGSESEVRVFAVADDQWDAETLVWDGRPAAGALLGAFEVTTLSDSLAEIDVTSYLVQQRLEPVLAGEVPQASFVLVSATGANPVGIGSGEEPDGEVPQLVLLPY